jgi:hypothetical protein
LAGSFAHISRAQQLFQFRKLETNGFEQTGSRARGGTPSTRAPIAASEARTSQLSCPTVSNQEEIATEVASKSDLCRLTVDDGSDPHVRVWIELQAIAPP